MKATLKVQVGEFGSVTLDLACPVSGEYEVTTTSDECLDTNGNSERFDPHRTTDATTTMKCSQNVLHFHSELQGEQSLIIQVKDARATYKIILKSPREGDEDEEEVISAENVEVEYIPYEEEE